MQLAPAGCFHHNPADGCLRRELPVCLANSRAKSEKCREGGAASERVHAFPWLSNTHIHAPTPASRVCANVAHAEFGFGSRSGLGFFEGLRQRRGYVGTDNCVLVRRI